jgi:hypothetical protein
VTSCVKAPDRPHTPCGRYRPPAESKFMGRPPEGSLAWLGGRPLPRSTGNLAAVEDDSFPSAPSSNMQCGGVGATWPGRT